MQMVIHTLSHLRQETRQEFTAHKVLSEYFFMVVYSCKKCGELNYLTPHAFWNIDNFILRRGIVLPLILVQRNQSSPVHLKCQRELA
jgi:hypothetical protein